MSVINDMLNDLEQRQYQQHPQRADSDFKGLTSATVTADRVRFSKWLIGVLVVGFFVWLGWGYFEPTLTASSAASNPVAISAAVTETVDPEPVTPLEGESFRPEGAFQVQAVNESVPPPPPSIRRIELRQHGETDVLELEFNQSLDVPLLQYRKGDRLWLRLFAANTSQVELPELPEHVLIHEWRAYLEDDYQMITLRVDQSTQARLTRLRPGFWRLNLQQQAAVLEEQSEVGHEMSNTSAPVFGDNPEKRELSASAEAMRSTKPVVQKFQDRYKTAEQALAKGLDKQAEKLLKEVLALEPEHLLASLRLARLYLESERWILAEPVILSALQQHPGEPELIDYLTRSLLGQDRLAEAADYLSSTMQQGYAPHLGLMAVIRQRQNDHREASRYYRLALQQRPDEHTWLTGLGISQEYLGDLVAARQAYQRSLLSGKLDPALHGFVQERLQQLAHYD